MDLKLITKLFEAFAQINMKIITFCVLNLFFIMESFWFLWLKSIPKFCNEKNKIHPERRSYIAVYPNNRINYSTHAINPAHLSAAPCMNIAEKREKLNHFHRARRLNEQWCEVNISLDSREQKVFELSQSIIAPNRCSTEDDFKRCLLKALDAEFSSN